MYSSELALKLDFKEPEVSYMAYMKGNIRKKVEIGYVNAPTQADIKKRTEITPVSSNSKIKKAALCVIFC